MARKGKGVLMKIYVQFTNGRSEYKGFSDKAKVVEWLLRNHGKIRKVDGVMLHDRDGNVVKSVVQ